MNNNAFTQNEVLAVASALDFLIENLQSEMKVVPVNEKEKYSKTIAVARETKNIFFEKSNNATYKQILLTVSALRSLTDFIADDLKNNTSPSERDEALQIQKYAFSAIRKLNVILKSIDN